jgi:hypothetical protein
MRINTSIDVAVPAEQLWDLFGENFADWADWTDTLFFSSLDAEMCTGAIRTCGVTAVGPVKECEVTEEVTHFDRDSMAVTYLVLSGLPGMMKRVENAWNIKKIDDSSCRISSDANFKLAWWIMPLVPLMKLQMKGAIKSFLRELKAAAETS